MSNIDADTLSRYVPDAILECIRRGTEPSCGTREVTVLFVDLHGFTDFSEPLDPEEVFRVLSRYTRCVSSVVRKHGGTVVEFNGDGMMAVFGAPQELPRKERAGVAAAREIAREMLSHWTLPEGQSPPVGMGVATGQAYVGNIQSADRLIWSAVGNTTNLASRLQKLSHELRSPVVIDAATWERAGASAGDFQRRPGMAIRGRRRSVDVFVLPPAPPR